MLPKGYLVNNEGRTVRKGTDGHWLCGSKQNVTHSDGWCGPTSGP